MNFGEANTQATNTQKDRHAVVVGSGPNGLTAAAVLAKAGWRVDVYEAGAHPGGAARSTDVLGEGTITDLGAAGHPFGVASPAFHYLGLEDYGLEWAYSRFAMAHPLDGGRAGLLENSVAATSERLKADARHWKMLHQTFTNHIDQHLANVLGPVLKWPKHPFRLAQFGLPALFPAKTLVNAAFETEEARSLFVGSAAHSVAPPDKPMTAAFGILFGALGMSRGWPVAVGGSGSIANALVKVIESHGGQIHCNAPVDSLQDFQAADAVILNQTPSQVLKLKGADLYARTARRMKTWKHGPSSFKVDYLLDGPIPWTNPEVGQATTVHVCGNSDEVAFAESEVAAGRMPQRPFVILCQQQVADPTRAREGHHVVWAYAHVPEGFVDKRASLLITDQIERFAPGFRDRIVHSVETNAQDLEAWNRNLVGGDITAGSALIRRMPAKIGEKTYMASASNAPGGGVHGMPGWWAARAVLADHS
ncbi:FAD dependent oxidoreductase [Corynebacterium suranareeae]|uniref:Pyridine nucleotide-disulfide oxidoreductase domain-containing protein 2 n=1 Tax=Corynebacterium suranareeae TaxID=2506452 RepID=A0A160PNL7_9CORY|nr:NAD(P)/FAD-dependent oxidoreductase [Corynebacterium suranareeae]BAU94885.1 FAD dependent oxidoreductase [Corynebacterium suranareeae]